MFNELNPFRKTIREGINTDNMEYRNIREFCGHDFVVDGFFFSEGKYGKQVVIVAEGYLVNMPARAVGTFEKIEADEEMLNAMLEGHMGINDIKIIEAKDGITTAYNFYDC